MRVEGPSSKTFKLAFQLCKLWFWEICYILSLRKEWIFLFFSYFVGIMGIRYEWFIVLVIHLYCLTPCLKILHSYWDVTFTRKRLQILGLSFSYYIWAGRDYFSWITCCDIGPWRLLARPKKRPIKIRCQTSHLKAWSNPLHEIGDFHCNWTSQTTNVTSYINFGPNVYLTEHRNYENQLIFYLHDH